MNRYFLPLVLAAALTSGCAKTPAVSTGADAQEFLQKWMDKFHPGILPNEDGLYMLEETPGSGAVRDESLAFIRAHYTVRSLDGTVLSNSREQMAKQLGTYDPANYYGPQYRQMGENYSYAGEDALLKGMKVGGTRKAVIPAWMMTVSRYDTQAQYIQACSSSTHYIYEISLEGQEAEYEDENIGGPASLIPNLKTYIENRPEPFESVSYITDVDPDGTFYFYSDTSSFDEEDKLASDASVKVNYTGKLLLWDGIAFTTPVFDTTVKENTDSRIFDETRNYAPQDVTLASNYSEITMGESSSLISGFKGALSLMHWKGQKAIAVFTAHHGYGASGSGDIIPGYATLIFELEILPDEDTEEE